MDSLDSRSLRYVDCFAQRFSKPGKVVYELTTAGPRLPVEQETFTINVAKGASREGSQHTVVVRPSGGRLRPEPEHLDIEVGDTVLWNTPDASLPGYVVRGKGPGGAFDSSALRDDALYTHAFGLPGTYGWLDANGGELSGEVVVEAPDPRDKRAAERWRDALRTGTLVKVSAKTVRPRSVTILLGQTVFWAVSGAGGVTITDARLAGSDSQATQARR
jgi:plastocyanin